MRARDRPAGQILIAPGRAAARHLAFDARATLVAGYRPEPAAPLATPVELTGGAFGALPRTYVSTAHDRVISPDLQSRMTTTTPMDRELTLETSHVPMLAAPDALAELLLDE